MTDLYPDNAHFIYELLQNAEDARAQTVRFTLTDKAVEFEHDGERLFSLKDVESITSIGTSTKKDDPTAIGKFGVGFKAVFAFTRTPEIHSGGFHFRIRDLVVPEEIAPGGVNGKTTFVFPFDNPKKDPKIAVARDVIRKECPANKQLRDALADLITEALPDIRDRDLLSMDFLGTLPVQDDQLEEFYKPIRQAIVNAFHEQDLTPAKGGGYRKVDELYRGPADISAVIDNDDLAFLSAVQPIPSWAANAPLQNGRTDKFLDSLEIDEWGWEQLAAFFEAVDFDDTVVVNMIEVWIEKKSDFWLMRFYGLLSHLNEQEDVNFDYDICKRLKLVRVESENASRNNIHLSLSDINLNKDNTARHVIPQEAFFPQEQGSSTKDVPFVKSEVYAKCGSPTLKKAAREFLTSIGVREYDVRAQLECRLRTYPGGKKVDENHFTDIGLFITYWKEHPFESALFKEHQFLIAHKRGDTQMWWTKPTCVCLDAPYEDTGLASLCDIHGMMILSDQYLGKLNKPISKQDFVAFLRAIGVMNGLIVKNCYVYDNPLIKGLGWWKQGRRTDNAINEDWIIEGIDKYRSQTSPTAKHSVARLIWSTLIAANPKTATARYRKNACEQLLQVPSKLVQGLKADAWIPDKDGVFRRPQDMTQDMLPDGFPYNNQNGLLTAIGFGENSIKQSEEHQKRETKAKELGFDSVDDAKRAQELLQAEKEGRLQINQQTAPEFPDRDVPNSARCSARIAAEVAAAPEKTYEMRERSVRISKGGVDVTTYLSAHYTNANVEMVCQCCQKEMPFKKRDGKPYFEAVEAFGHFDITKEHEAQHLALCPLCAAKFKEFVKRDDKARRELKEAVQKARGGQREFDIDLDVPARLRFTEKHLIDLRAVLSTPESTGV